MSGAGRARIAWSYRAEGLCAPGEAGKTPARKHAGDDAAAVA